MASIGRGTALAGLLLLVALAGAQPDLGQKVTLTVSAAPAKRALAELSRVAGVQLEVATNLADDVLVLRLRDVRLSEAMTRIANAVNAGWAKTDRGGYRLERAPKVSREEEDRERQQDIDAFVKGLNKRREEMEKSVFDAAAADALAGEAVTLARNYNPRSRDASQWQQIERLDRKGPGTRALTRILAFLDPADLAIIPAVSKVVYSTHPNRLQRPLDRRVWGAVEMFVQEQNLWASAAERRGVGSPTVGNTTYYIGQMAQHRGHVHSPPAEALLTAFRWSGGSGVRLTLLIADARGKVIGRAETNIGYEWDGVEGAPPPKPKKDDVKLVLSPELKALHTFMRGRVSRGGVPAELPSETRARALEPEKHDPLSLLAGPICVALGETKGLNVVATLPDNMVWGVTGFIAAEEPTVEQVLVPIRLMSEVEEGDGWLMLRAKRPAEARRTRMDRLVLGKYLRRITSGRKLSLDERAAFALALPEPQENNMPEFMAGLVGPRRNENYHDPNMLRLYGLLSKAQRRAATEGEGLRLGSLTPPQLARLDKMVYANPYGQNLQFQPPRDEQGRYIGLEEGQSPWELYYNGLLSEPTESLPIGIPPDGTLKMDVDASEVVFTTEVQRQDWVQPGQAMNADQLAWARFSESRPELFPWMNDENYGHPNLSAFRLGSRQKLDFTFRFTPSLSMSHSLQDNDVQPGAPIPYEKLPEAFRRQVAERMEKLKKDHANATPGRYVPQPHPVVPP